MNCITHLIIIIISRSSLDRRVQFVCCTISLAVRKSLHGKLCQTLSLCRVNERSRSPPPHRRHWCEPHKLTHQLITRQYHQYHQKEQSYSFLIKSASQSPLSLSRGRTYIAAAVPSPPPPDFAGLFSLHYKTNNIFYLILAATRLRQIKVQHPKHQQRSIKESPPSPHHQPKEHGPGDSSAGRGGRHSPSSSTSNGPCGREWSSHCTASSRNGALSAGQSQAKYQPTGVYQLADALHRGLAQASVSSDFFKF